MLKNYQGHWFVVNVLVEIPVLGSFFKEETQSEAIYAAGKCIVGTIGSVIGMMSITGSCDSDGTTLHISKVTAGMLVGKTIATTAYNGVYHSTALLYNFVSCRSKNGNDANPDYNNNETSLELARLNQT